MSIRKNFLTSTVLATLMALILAVSAQAETLRPKVDNFILFVDYSGSMAMQSDTYKSVKIKHAKELLTRINAEIPALNYQSGVATFAPYSVLQAPQRTASPPWPAPSATSRPTTRSSTATPPWASASRILTRF